VSNPTDEVRKDGGGEISAGGKDWPLMRKVEALVFLAMFLAVPLFAFRVLAYTHSQLMVRNICRELVLDLGRVKAMAIKTKQNVEVSGSTTLGKYHRYSYSISTPGGLVEEIVLPEDVSVSGSITFTDSGKPVRPSSFIVTSFNRNTTVEIDKIGVVTVP
jgi:hypothetical protein